MNQVDYSMTSLVLLYDSPRQVKAKWAMERRRKSNEHQRKDRWRRKSQRFVFVVGFMYESSSLQLTNTNNCPRDFIRGELTTVSQ